MRAETQYYTEIFTFPPLASIFTYIVLVGRLPVSKQERISATYEYLEGGCFLNT